MRTISMFSLVSYCVNERRYFGKVWKIVDSKIWIKHNNGMYTSHLEQELTLEQK
jgi:hypothetical protein